MATALQWLAKPLARPTIVVSGKSSAMVSYIVSLLEQRLRSGTTEVYRFSAEDTTVRTFMEEMADQHIWANRVIFVLHNVHLYPDLDAMQAWLEAPDPGRIVILTANEIRNDKNSRWIPSDERVLYIDCAHLDLEQLEKFCGLHGIAPVDIPWLLDKTNGSIAEILKLVDLLSVFPRPWEPGLVKQLYPKSTNALEFTKYAIFDNGDDNSLVRQLSRRMVQLATLSEMGKTGASVLDMSRRAEIEPFLVARLMPTLRNSSVESWVQKAAQLELVTEYAHAGFPVREVVAAII